MSTTVPTVDDRTLSTGPLSKGSDSLKKPIDQFKVQGLEIIRNIFTPISWLDNILAFVDAQKVLGNQQKVEVITRDINTNLKKLHNAAFGTSTVPMQTWKDSKFYAYEDLALKYVSDIPDVFTDEGRKTIALQGGEFVKLQHNYIVDKLFDGIRKNGVFAMCPEYARKNPDVSPEDILNDECENFMVPYKGNGEQIASLYIKRCNELRSIFGDTSKFAMLVPNKIKPHLIKSKYFETGEPIATKVANLLSEELSQRYYYNGMDLYFIPDNFQSSYEINQQYGAYDVLSSTSDVSITDDGIKINRFDIFDAKLGFKPITKELIVECINNCKLFDENDIKVISGEFGPETKVFGQLKFNSLDPLLKTGYSIIMDVIREVGFKEFKKIYEDGLDLMKREDDKLDKDKLKAALDVIGATAPIDSIKTNYDYKYNTKVYESNNGTYKITPTDGALPANTLAGLYQLVTYGKEGADKEIARKFLWLYEKIFESIKSKFPSIFNDDKYCPSEITSGNKELFAWDNITREDDKENVWIKTTSKEQITAKVFNTNDVTDLTNKLVKYGVKGLDLSKITTVELLDFAYQLIPFHTDNREKIMEASKLLKSYLDAGDNNRDTFVGKPENKLAKIPHEYVKTKYTNKYSGKTAIKIKKGIFGKDDKGYGYDESIEPISIKIFVDDEEEIKEKKIDKESLIIKDIEYSLDPKFRDNIKLIKKNKNLFTPLERQLIATVMFGFLKKQALVQMINFDVVPPVEIIAGRPHIEVKSLPIVLAEMDKRTGFVVAGPSITLRNPSGGSFEVKYWGQMMIIITGGTDIIADVIPSGPINGLSTKVFKNIDDYNPQAGTYGLNNETSIVPFILTIGEMEYIKSNVKDEMIPLTGKYNDINTIYGNKDFNYMKFDLTDIKSMEQLYGDKGFNVDKIVLKQRRNGGVNTLMFKMPRRLRYDQFNTKFIDGTGHFAYMGEDGLNMLRRKILPKDFQ